MPGCRAIGAPAFLFVRPARFFLIDPHPLLVYNCYSMFHFRLHAKFLSLILGILVIAFGTLSYAIVQREARLLIRKGVEKQHILAQAIFADLQDNMLTGRPRSTLTLMKSLQGAYGLVRLEALRKDGAPAFHGKGGRFSIPQLEQAFATGAEIQFQEKGSPPLNTILFPLKNEQDCRVCHGSAGDILGVILISLSMEDTFHEIAKSKRDLSVLFSILIITVGGALYVVIRKVILKPIVALHQGAERIGKGDFSQRISLATRDEIQDLAQTFNTMAVRLKESYSVLENKVGERTAEVEDKARRLYYHSRDMAVVSRLSTKVFNAESSLEELLDNFMSGITGGLGHTRVMLCLVDRKRSRLDVMRSVGMDDVIPFSGQSLTGSDLFMQLVRTARILVVNDITKDTPSWLSGTAWGREPLSLYVIPILSRARNKKCWELTSCIKTDCPAHNEDGEFCWLVEHTLCGNPLVESCGDKLTYCMTCKVFPVVGVLVVADDRRRRSLHGRSVSALRILAAEMGAALENHRLHEDNRQMVRELLELHRVTAAALSELSLDKALEVFTDSALKFSGLDACNFWLASPDGRELVRRAGGCVDQASDEDRYPERLPADRGLLGQAFAMNRYVIEYNVARSDDTSLGAAASTLGFNSLFAVPLKTEGRPIGVFAVYKKSAIPFLETEIAAYMLLANQAAMAISVCTLNEELKGQNIELARSTGLMRGILASMSNGVMLLDMEAGVKLINFHGAQILRRRQEEVAGRRLSDAVPETAALETAAFIKADAGSHQEIELRLSDGTTVPIGFSSTYYRGAASAYEGVIVVFRDMTEIKALQAELLMKERFAAMGRVVAGVAHEVRNPLFGISSIAQIFERELMSPAHQELARALLSESRRLDRLVEELLIYGRPINLRLAPCDLGKLWEEVFEMHKDELERRGVKISGDYGVRHPFVYLDAHQMRQVLLNLFRNALDAVPDGGEIVIRLLIEDRHIFCSIADTGAGIPAKNADRVFELFFTTKPKGTGLGLAICKKIVQDHGGDIFIASTEGSGTTITVKLPYKGITEK